MEDPDFRRALTQDEGLQRKVLSMIHEEDSESRTGECIEQKIQQLASLSHISYERNSLYRSQE